MSTIDQIYTKKEVCKILKVSTTTLWRLAQSKDIVPIKIGGRSSYKGSEIQEYIDNCTNIRDQVI